MISEKTEVPNAIRSLDGAMRKADPLERIRLEKLKEHLENGSPAHDINRLLKEAV
jgi:hypothetical protein